MAKLKSSLYERLQDYDQDMLFTIINELVKKFPELKSEVELLINPTEVNNPFVYYKKLVVSEIKTHNYDCFPNKGIDGLNKVCSVFHNYINMRLYSEAWKLGAAMLFVIFRCEYSTKNEIELEEIEMKILDQLSNMEFQDFGLDKIKTNFFKTILLNRFKTVLRISKFQSKFHNDHDKELINQTVKMIKNKKASTK